MPITDCQRTLCALAAVILAAGVPTSAHQPVPDRIDELTRRIEARPHDADLHLRRGELHRIRREWDQALADYRRSRELDPGLAAVDLCAGRMLLEADRPDGARAALDRFLARSPDHPAGLALRGRAAARLGRPREAAADLTRAIAAHAAAGERPHPDLFLQRARALRDAGDVEQALAGLDEGLALLGDPVLLELEALELERGLGRMAGALERLERLAARSPRPESWLVLRGEVLEQAGRRDEAGIAYRSALDAMATLPEHRRGTGGARRLEDRARAGVERLEASRAPEAGR